MLFYGDIEQVEGSREKLAGLARALAALAEVSPGIERHGALVAAFIEASELAQGLADAEFEVLGQDSPSLVQDAATALLTALGGAVVRSWSRGFAVEQAPGEEEVERLRSLSLPERIRTKRAEGYAFYALYPESYAEAALQVAGRGPFIAIGIRSIGLGLAAIVAAALGAPPPISLRPVGDPFRRRIAASPELEARVRGADATFLVVDEGPGLSGSSFGAVADWLEGQGVPRERIVFLPSHAGDLGPQGSEVHRERWATASRHVVEFDELLIRASEPAHRLENWLRDLCGPSESPLQDLSGGSWRSLVYESEAAWPAANVQQERRKYLLRSGNGPWLLKFGGLGGEGSKKLARAHVLHRAGFTPQPLTYRHGFLVERWLIEARPMDLADVDRAHLVETVSRYLAFRARTFPVAENAGAGVEKLLAMARRNTELALGSEAAAALERWGPQVARLQNAVSRVDTDNRLQSWEWVVTPGGGILKTDALDHSAAHDLVGSQDIAWDVAGATVELALDDSEQAQVMERVARESGRPLDPGLLAFSRIAYLAFQVGAQNLAAQALVGWPAEAERLRRAETRYREALGRALSVG